MTPPTDRPDPAFLQGLGWFVLRNAAPHRRAAFYRGVVGLPQIREWDEAAMIWAGCFTVLEIGVGGGDQLAPGKPEDAPCIPIFRCRNFDETIIRATRAGGELLRHSESADGRFVFLRDSVGDIFGYREIALASRLATDREAWRRLVQDDEVRVAGIGPMPADIHDLGIALLHVIDVAAERDFYRDAVGLSVVADDGAEGATLSFGDMGLLWLRPGGPAQAHAPKDRKDVGSTFIMRAYDFASRIRYIESKGARQVNQIEFRGGHLNYYLDPEGRMFGVQERKPWDPANSFSHNIEDREARNAWQRQWFASAG